MLSYKPRFKSDALEMEYLYGIVVNGSITSFIGVLEGKIEMLFVLPEYYRQGQGKLLVEKAIKDFSATEVDCNEQNPQGVKFYEAMGFSTISRSPLDMLGKPFPILHMKLQ